jgi:hypothetical protein
MQSLTSNWPGARCFGQDQRKFRRVVMRLRVIIEGGHDFHRRPAAKRFFRKALERHGRPDRVVIDGSQTNREAIVSCDATHRSQDGSRRRLKPIRIRQKPVSQQPHRAGPSAHQAPRAVDARLQIANLGQHHAIWHRNGSHDAQTTGEIRLQSRSVPRRAVPHPRRIDRRSHPGSAIPPTPESLQQNRVCSCRCLAAVGSSADADHPKMGSEFHACSHSFAANLSRRDIALQAIGPLRRQFEVKSMPASPRAAILQTLQDLDCDCCKIRHLAV